MVDARFDETDGRAHVDHLRRARISDRPRTAHEQQCIRIDAERWIPYWNLLGNGGLISTAEDFVAFRRAYRSGAIVPSVLVEESQRKQVPENARGSSHYGYGLVVQDHRRLGRIHWHDGGNDIFSAIWIDLPERDDIIFTAAVDAGDDNATAVLRVITKHLYGVDDF